MALCKEYGHLTIYFLNGNLQALKWLNLESFLGLHYRTPGKEEREKKKRSGRERKTKGERERKRRKREKEKSKEEKGERGRGANIC